MQPQESAFKNLKNTNYVISMQHMLGKGSYGEVYLAYDTQTKKYMAVKQINLTNMDDKHLELIQNEIKNMRQISHPHVVRLFDVVTGMKKKNLYLFMEFCDGGSLEDYMKQKGGRISESEAREIMRQLVDGYMCLLSNNIVHRDIKPANVILNKGVPKLTDFGFSKCVDDLKVANFRTRVGTPHYMSPQILEGDDYTKKTDIWSLGILFFKILYGIIPWDAKTEMELKDKISKSSLEFPDNPLVTSETKKLIMSMLRFNEDDRIE
jgi:serine/threonine protein kinase